MDCPDCLGTGDCEYCDGTGKQIVDGGIGPNRPCNECEEYTGKCSRCDGTGKI